MFLAIYPDEVNYPHDNLLLVPTIVSMDPTT